MNDTLCILFIRLCKMSLSYEESDIFFERRGEVSGSRVCETLGVTLWPTYVTEPCICMSRGLANELLVT